MRCNLWMCAYVFAYNWLSSSMCWLDLRIGNVEVDFQERLNSFHLCISLATSSVLEGLFFSATSLCHVCFLPGFVLFLSLGFTHTPIWVKHWSLKTFPRPVKKIHRHITQVGFEHVNIAILQQSVLPVNQWDCLILGPVNQWDCLLLGPVDQWDCLMLLYCCLLSFRCFFRLGRGGGQ